MSPNPKKNVLEILRRKSHLDPDLEKAYEEEKKRYQESLKKSQRLKMSIIKKAENFARIKHALQEDDCGKSYFDSHIIQVVNIISQITDDENVICAAFLHDTIEDTETTYEEIIENFGKTIADLVLEVTHEGKKDAIGFYFPRLKSKDAILIKFADRISNLSRMESWSEDRKNHYLKKSKFWKSTPNNTNKDF